jgi:uncharacterized protein
MTDLTVNPPPPTLGAMAPQATSLRSLAPDLSRGVMLLLIAIVHAQVFRVAWANGDGSSFALSGTLDVIVTWFMTIVFEDRGFALFAMLFGYGMTQLYQRRIKEGREWPVIRKLLRRRGWWLIAFGLGHTVLLAFGDILSVYGLVALLFVGMLRYSGKKLLAHAFGWLVVGTFFYSVSLGLVFGMLSGGGGGEPVVPTYFTDMSARLAWPVMIPLMIASGMFPFIVGIWAARKRMLDEPQKHRPFLRKVAVLGIAGGLLGGIPYVLTTTGVWWASQVEATGVYWLNTLASYAGGFGYAAAIALVAIQIGNRRGVITNALVATGQRSMTCYLLQSVAWLLLAPAYTLGLGHTMSDIATVGTGIAVWVGTVILCDFMERRGIRGPAEAGLRRLTYGRAGSGS